MSATTGQNAADILGVDDEIVTGEGVALELPAATVLSRIVSGLIDYLLYALVLWAFMSWGSNNIDILAHGGPNPLYQIYLICSLAFVLWILPSLVTSLSRGSSLGKLITRSKTVRYDGGTITVRQSFMRHLVGVFEVWLTLGLLALSTSIVSKRGLRIGDMLAGTYVVRWPKSSLPEFEVQMPAELADWASTVQTRSLPPELSNLMTDHIQRRDKLDKQVRARKAAALAAEVESYVAPPPPWGTPAEDFLDALTIVRSHHNVMRGTRQRERYASTLDHIAQMPYGLEEK